MATSRSTSVSKRTSTVPYTRNSTEPIIASPFFASTAAPTTPATIAVPPDSKPRKRKHIAIQVEEDVEDDDFLDETQPSKSGASSEPSGEAPVGWQFLYNAIAAQRKGITAAVDKFGAEACSSLDDSSLPESVRRYHTLVALMLSSQTKDEVTYNAMLKLKAHGLTIDNILATSDSKLDSLISQVGFHNKKTQSVPSPFPLLIPRLDPLP